MSEAIIQVENLGKRYQIKHQTGERYTALRDVLARKVKNLLPSSKDRHPVSTSEDFWALKDVSFTVNEGEVVGIIGRNGAGKSTLLKILSRITEPTTGRVTLGGRVASLLEVGTGFHPELTGRENIFLNGAILGMTKAEIRRKFDEIVAFAEVEKFLDTPVKRYSSGMYVRLAFAVAAHLEPEILVVDEVLAVGDAQFQKKCLGKMGDVARTGRTILFVSHNISAVRSLCTRVVLLDSGQLRCDRNPDEAIDSYLKDFASVDHDNAATWNNSTGFPGNDRIRVRSVRIFSNASDPESALQVGKASFIECEFWKLAGPGGVMINYVITTIEGTPICELVSKVTPSSSSATEPFQITCCLPNDFLNSGQYRLKTYFLDETPAQLYELPHEVTFSVVDTAKREIEWHGRFLGYFRPHSEWTVRQLTM